MSLSSATSELQSSLADLALANKSPVKDVVRPPLTSIPSKPKKPSAPIADSWEDEADDDSASASASELDPPAAAEKRSTASSSRFDSPALSSTEDPLDPPPTPISPSVSQSWSPRGYGNVGSSTPVPREDSRSPARRPEKQTAVAGRMIAGALGIRAPKRTEEQRAYDRAVKEQEIKRRNREKEEAEKARADEEKVKAAVWDD
ncbi:hypothetical protein BO70DRAFT_129001 [Aspergillus heteromorphus CBS 117.55]|uniref:Ubiquitin-like protein smt3 n=1 Tax=Aspergillus heteromorphus CBS 117.55 TaxID=1448321 RepID=A0A317WYD7_9EURO|nr:uncharacterized protein BO70DRAFT_129001 [Aspergillus heteromorphus CBS 117.55]PWY89798.1 hypothetical protein BO70DRAFT_129001 [Aspergillus heteromorphus CBS 117.55]